MRAALVTALTGPGGVEVRDVPEPVAAAGQVLIDVRAAGVVYPDVLRSRGAYQARPELPFIGGWEVAGVVRAAAGGLVAGQRVAALPGVGGFAEVVAADAGRVFPLPEGVPYVVAAAVPLNYLAMDFAYRQRAHLGAGETVLVHGAAGGMGSAACQLAAAAGARVIAVASGPDREAVARATGAADVVPVEGFRDAVREVTGGRGVDLVVDPVGGDRFTDSLRTLAPEGRVLVLGFTGGDIPTVRVNRLLLGNTSVIGAGSMEYWREHPEDPARRWRDLAPLLAAGAIAPPIGATYPLEDAAAAIRALEERRVAGRIVIEVA